MGYEWDLWYLAHLVGIEPHEVMQALLDARPRLPVPMLTAEDLTVATVWCRTRKGRPIVVALASANRSLDKIIRGVRDLTEQEQARFAAWEATRRD